MKSCENCRYRAIDENALPCCACIELGPDLSGWVGLTNADRIRGMTDEELAEWTLREPFVGYFAFCPPGTKDGGDCPTSPCEQCWLDWLKSPVEVKE